MREIHDFKGYIKFDTPIDPLNFTTQLSKKATVKMDAVHSGVNNGIYFWATSAPANQNQQLWDNTYRSDLVYGINRVLIVSFNPTYSTQSVECKIESSNTKFVTNHPSLRPTDTFAIEYKNATNTQIEKLERVLDKFNAKKISEQEFKMNFN